MLIEGQSINQGTAIQPSFSGKEEKPKINRSEEYLSQNCLDQVLVKTDHHLSAKSKKTLSPITLNLCLAVNASTVPPKWFSYSFSLLLPNFSVGLDSLGLAADKKSAWGKDY